MRLFILLVAFMLSAQAFAANFPVTNTYDSGPGSLRQAILDVNAAGTGPHNIEFSVYGQITILSNLPQITKSNITIDGQNKIVLNANQAAAWFFWLNADNVTIRNFRLQNTIAGCVLLEPNHNNNTIENIVVSSTTNNIDQLVYISGNSTGLTLKNITCRTGIEVCNGSIYGRAFYFAGGIHTNLVMDGIHLSTVNNTTGCEAVVFRDASVNGWTFTNSNISGFLNGIVLDNLGGPIETANNILLNNVTIDSLYSGTGLGFYSDFVNTGITIKNSTFNQDVIGTTDDGDYNIRFDNTTNGITIDSVTVKGTDIYTVWFNGAASNISIKHSTLDGAQGEGITQVLRFESTVNTLTLQKVNLEGDRPGTTDDAEYGILFVGATTNVTLDSLTVNEFDGDGVYIIAANTNFQLTNSTFTNNFDGIEFYYSVPRTNVDITNSVFRGSTRSGIVINAANPTSDIDLTGDTVQNSASNGIWLYGGAGITDMTISGSVIRNNGGAGIYNELPTKVIYTGNSIYNNTSLGIDNAGGNCNYQAPNVPTLVSSTPLGGGQYELVINLPALVPSGYTVDIYANDPATSVSSGQYFVTSLTGLTSGANTRTFTYNTGPGATGIGFWTATLRIPLNNCGTSEFSAKLNIGIKAPACITNGIVGWYRADMGVNGMIWGDISGNANHLQAFGDPDDTTGLVNFNKAFYYDGNDDHRAPASAGVTTAYTMMGLGRLEGTQNGRVFSSTTGNKLFGWWGNGENGYFNEAWLKNTTAITNYTKLYSLKRTNTGSGPYEFKGNGTLLSFAAASNAAVWTLNVGAVNGGEASKVFVPEVFIYSRDLTPPEMQRIESYMALKYGITLNNGLTDYVASDGTTLMWTVSANTGYGKRITGIGKDDCTMLHQKQSLSADTGMVTMALGNSIAISNATNTNSITTDKTFLVFSDNNGSIAYATAVTGTEVNMRMARVFKVQKSAAWTDQNITLKIKGAGANNYLLISTDPAFGTISQELQLNADGAVTISSNMLANAVYFTVGANIQGPNSVNAGVALWLRADDGAATGAQWNDFSGNGNGAAQASAAKQPAVNAAGVNFNPALKFNGTSTAMLSPSLFTASGTANIAIFAVSATDVVQAASLFSEYLSPAGTFNNAVNAHVPYSDGILYWDGPYGYRMTAPWGGAVTNPYLWSFTRSATNQAMFRNTRSLASVNGTYANIPGNGQPFGIGAWTNGTAGFFNGKIAELVVYNNAAAMTATDRQKIQSYLAIKYGITMDQTVVTNYLASDATVYWNATTNSAYTRHITGIGRDSVTALNQKQSLSVDTGYVTIALGSAVAATNAANSGTITNNKSFFVTGDNGGAKTFSNAITGLPGVNISLARIWKVQKTNWADQNITLATDSTLPAPQYLIISTDATFGAGDLALSVTNRSITVNTSQLPDGAFFTFANAFKAPGNVTTGIAAWWRADVEAAAASWTDYSGNGKTLTQSSVANQAAVLPVNINYQPAVKLHPTAWLTSTSLFGTASTNNIAIFSVSAADGAGSGGIGSGLFSEYVSNGDRIASWAPYGNGHIYWYPPLGWNVNSTTPLVAYANPRFNIYGFTKTPSQLNIYFNNTTVGTANGAFTGINGNNQGFILGAFSNLDYFNGRVAEFIVYNNSAAMTATDRQKIQSYLALKYGITLSPTAPVDYLASDGTTMWAAAANAGYGLHITGIGRDDSSALYQKQSRSIDTGVVAIGAGSTIAASNLANTTVITNNKSFIVFGDNGASTAYLTTVTGITGVTSRMTRIFKVDKTNWADQDITFKLNGGNARTYLVVSTDATFGAGDVTYVLNADSTVTLNSSNLADGAYFTFATTIKGPNAVNAGTVLWLRADDGTANGSQWNDFSGYGLTATQPVVTSQPATDAKLFNFNYGLKFDGGDYLTVPNNQINQTFPFGNTDRTLIAVSSKPSAVLGTIFSYGNNVAATGNGLYVSAAQQQIYFGWGSDLAGPLNTYRLNTPSIFTGRHSSAAGTNTFIDLNGINNASGAFTWNTNNTREFRVGIDPGNTQLWPGNIAEIIVYNRLLNATELQSVNSYLSLKYGITMNGGAANYLASDNTVYWTIDATYKNRITGIGRDDSTALYTKQSLSADTGIVTLALGTGVPLTNEVNSNTITNNKSFLTFADNGLSASNFTVQFLNSTHNVTRRMARVWKVQKTNWADQNITLKIKPIGIDNYLIISSDPTFATFTQELPVAADGTVTLSSALFTGTDLYFTFGAPLKSPGGVSGHALWVRADIGTSSTTDNVPINEWSDISAFANTLAQATPASQPLYLNNTTDNINFNPVARFRGAGAVMTGASVLKAATYNGAGTFVVNSQATALNSSVFAEATTSGLHFNLHATYSDNVVYMDVPPNRITYNAGNINNQVNIWTGSSDISLPANKQELFKNGLTVSTGNATGTYTGNNSPIRIGEGVNGRLPEVILYTSPLSAQQRQRVNTYLSIKYGITLNSGLTSYLATDGTTVWDATANTAYRKNIGGIGRDDEEALQQRQSRSINTGLQVTIGLGGVDSVNSANPNNFTANRSYLVWGDDSTAVTFRTPTGFAEAGFRMTRIWKVQETGTVGAVQVAIPANALANPAKSYLIVSADNVFDATDEYIPLTPLVINGVNNLAAMKDFNTGQFFTFATDLKVPGGVAAPTLWLRADFGTSSTVDATAFNEWDDFGADINHALQPVLLNQPVYLNNASSNVNFNPVVRFNGTNSFMDLDITKLPMGTSARTVLALARPFSTAGTNKYMLSWGQSVLSQGTAVGSYTTTAGAFVGYGDDLTTATGFWQNGQPNVLMGVWNGAGGATNIYSKHRLAAGPVNKNWNTTGTVARIGNSSFAATQPEYWNGHTGELIVYPFDLNAGHRLKVESYMAIKYGYTIDQTTANNYLATDSSVIWNATTNATYRFGITGIGRDDLEGLNQKQSRNTDTTRLRIAIGLGALAETNIDNANTFTADKSYLIWGDDNASTSFRTVVAGNSNVNYRMARLWTAQETGTVGEVEVAFPYDALPNPRQSYLVVSADATIDNSDTYIPLYDITINGKRHWAAKTDFTNGQFFTVAAFIKSPGGVGATNLWVRADHGILNNTDGTPADLWVDFGNEVNNASQLTAGIQPVYRNNATDNINYNPVVKFNGTSQYMNLDITKLPMGTTPRTVIGVAKPDNITGTRYIAGWGTGVASQGMGLANVNGLGYWVGWGNDLITAAGFWQLNTPNELFGTWTGAGGPASLYSKITPVATTANKAWNTVGTIARIGTNPWLAEYWSGPISEVIAFDRALNDNERQRVSTYLAIRNGYTINQTTPYSNYLNTNSTVIWDAAANTAYSNNIAGIGRDDIEGLNQKQSKSINVGAIVAIGLGNIASDNLANMNAFNSDTSYLIWGSNSTALTISTTDVPVLFSRRLTQEWKVSLSQFDNQLNNVSMEFDLTGVTHGGTTTADFNLLIDTDGDGNFTTGIVTTIPASAYASNKASFTGVSQLVNGAVFTVAVGPQSLRVTTKVNLQGAWNGSSMNTALKTAAVIPATDPYGQNTTPFVAPNASPAAVVDWVLVELRDDANPATVVASRAAFVLANGNVVDTNYTQPVSFYNVAPGNYRVAIRHRNHLGTMTLNAVDFSTGSLIDFTNSATVTYGSNAQKDLGGGILGMWAGDVDGDGWIRHSGKPSDAALVSNAVLTHAGNGSGSPGYTGFINAYSPFDVNLDGRVYYTASPSDHTIITSNVKTHPANTFGLTTFVIKQQLP